LTTAAIGEFLEKTGEFLERVRNGETITIVDGGEEIAAIVARSPAGALEPLASETIDRKVEWLVARGKARRGTGTLPELFFTQARPEFPGDLLQQVLDDRKEGW
jgi:antitoxin (DNA-binding transcriptional repressor) of toxin-antitoxin stability system